MVSKSEPPANSLPPRSETADLREALPFRELAQYLASPCWISDADGAIAWVNDAWIAYTGADVEAIRVNGLEPLHDPAVYSDVVARWEAAKAGGAPAEMTFPLKGKDGAFRPFHTHVVPVFDGAGRLTQWFGVNTDIAERTKTEARLRSSEEQLREVFERAGDGIFITDGAGKLVDVNPAACTMGQYSRDELLGMSVWDLITPDDREVLADARNQDDSIRDWKIRRKDGSLLYAEVGSRRLSDGRRLGVARDVSERRRSEENQKRRLTDLLDVQAARAAQAERHLAHFWDASRDLFAIISSIDGIARMINERAWTETLGYSAAEIMGARMMTFVHPDDQARTMENRHAHIADRGYFGFENRYVAKNGDVVWLSWNVVREDDLIYASGRDITLDRQARGDLARSDRQFRLLVASVVDYALFMLTPDGIVANWNAGAERIKGYSSAEIVGSHMSAFYTDTDQAAGRPALALTTAREQGRYEAEGWRVRKDGTLFWANVVIDAVHDEDGQLIGFAKITRDITERRNAQLELQKANERLAHAQKTEALGQLTGGVAHDFNNLLMVMGGQAELLRGRVGDDPRVTRSLDAIVTAAKRGQELTRHLLAFARRQRLNPTAVALSSRSRGLKELISSTLGAGIKVDIDFPDDLWPVEVDINELELAVLNMSVNARDAMPNGGQLTIGARNTVVSAAEGQDIEGDFVTLTVADTGAGIPADILPRVVDPFFTTKEVNKGTGLGLSQVFGFVQQSGGRLNIDSELGRGTTISLVLPRSASEPTMAAEQGALSAAEGLSILCVEDNPDVADVAAGFLEQLGHRVRLTTSAEGAIQILDEGMTPDLVFSDIVMAGELDGLGLARRIRERWPALPVLLATGYSRTARAIGDEFRVLAKPYQISDLSKALSEVIRRAG